MVGIIFAAGIGSRLKPFTDNHPKALAPIAGVPAIKRVSDHMVHAGARAIVVNVHHFPQQVIDYLATLQEADIIEISDESDMLLDTGGALAKMWRESHVMTTLAPDEPVLVHNADIVTDFPIDEMIKCAENADATILVDPHRNSSRHFLFNNEGCLQGWENTQKGITRPEGLDTSALTPAAFGGVHVLNSKIIEDISASAPEVLEPFSITDWYIDHCATHRIKAYTPSLPYRWHDIGTPEKLAAANEALA